jgi:two-component system, OmpR family, phosphate regulon sensor histidine kinase PhoR
VRHRATIHRTVARTLRGATAVMLLCLLLAGLGGAGALTVVVWSFERVTQDEVPLLSANERALAALTDAQSAKRGFVLTGNESLLAEYAPDRVAFVEAMDQLLSLDSGVDRRVAAAAAAQRAAGLAWLDGFADPMIEAIREGEPTALVRATTSDAHESFQAFQDANRSTEELIQARVDLGLERARTTGRLASVLLGLLVAVALVVGARSARRATSAVTDPLSNLVAVLQRLRAGDLTARLDTDGPTEVAAVAEAVNQLAGSADRLRDSQQAQIAVAHRIRRLANLMHPLLDMDQVLEVAVTELAELGDRAVARRIALDSHLPVIQRIASGVDAPPVRDQRYPSQLLDLVLEAANDRRCIAIPDAWTDERLDDESRRFCADNGIRSTMVSAVRAGPDELVVLAVHDSAEVRVWTEAELAVFDGCLRETATAVANAAAFAQQQQVVDRLEQLDREKTDFMSNVSHELRTPLTSIIGYGELLAEGDAGELNEDQAGLLRTISRNSTRLLDLIEDLLILSRIESGTFSMAQEPVEITPLVHETVTALRPLFRGRPVELVLDVPSESGVVFGDHRQLERVLLNLLTNAVKFSAPEGTIALTVRCEGGEVVLTVTDTGIGIPEDELELLFGRFYRTTTSQEQAIQGTGLGLSISKTIVERHGGSIAVRSRQDVGSTFEVRLPLTDARSTEGNASCLPVTSSS